MNEELKKNRCVCCGGILTSFNDSKDSGMCVHCRDPTHEHSLYPYPED